MVIFKVKLFSRSNISELFWQRRDRYLVTGLILLGFLLRLPSLRLGLWRDEASTYFDAIPSQLGEVVKTVIRSELNPPGFFLIMHQWIQWFGTGEIVLKVPALLFGLLLIVATYWLGRVVSSRTTGLIAAAITTIAPTAVYYSQEARPYTLAALLACLVVLLYCKAIDSVDKRQCLLGFVLCASLLTYVQYTGLLLIVSLAVVTVYLLWRGETRVRLTPFAFAFGAIFLLFTPWLPVFFTHLHTGTPWSNTTPWVLRSRLFIDCVAFTIPVMRLRSLIVVPVILALGVGAIRLFYHTVRSSHIVILAASMGLVAISEAALSNNGGGRYMFLITPIAYVLYTHWTITLLRYLNRRTYRHRIRSVLRIAVLFLFLCWMVFPNMLQAISFGDIAKSGVRSLSTNIEKWHVEQAVYLLAPDYLGPTFGYYAAQTHSVPFYGFARWDHPELFTPQGYAELWKSPTLVANVKKRIQDEVQKGFHWLFFIKDTTPALNTAFSNQIDHLLSELQHTYPLELKIDYPSSDFSDPEAVSLYLFSIKPHGSTPILSPTP